MKKLLLSLTPALLFASEAEILKRLDTLEHQMNQQKKEHLANSDILETIETKSILDKLNFSPELELRMDRLEYQVGDIEGEETKIYGGEYDGEYRRKAFNKSFNPATSIRFRLNMSARLDATVKFYGRLIFAYNSQSYQRLCILSRDIKSLASTSGFSADRAYFDYTPNFASDYPFTFSFGLLPTTGGTPMQYATNHRRNSMFPALVFDMNTYGVIATQKMASQTYLRAIIARAFTLDAPFYPYQCNRENIDNADVMGLYGDTTIGAALISGGFNYLANFKAHPYLGPDVSSNNAHVLGDIATLGLGIDLANPYEAPLTLFAHYALSLPVPNGKEDDYQIVATDSQTLADGLTKDGITGFSEASYAKGSMIDHNGYALYIGTKWQALKNLSFGAEYNYGSKYWFAPTQGAEDMFNKLATRGHVGELYGLWNFHKNLFAKVGYMYTDENYTSSGWHFGEPSSKEGIQQVSYLSLNARF